MGSIRFVGDTETCFHDFMEKGRGMTLVRLVAELCNVDVEKVQRWQRGAYFPGGDDLLRLRSVLYIAGYELTDIHRLQGDAKTLALTIGLGLLKAKDVQSKLQYNAIQSLWRILVHGDGYSLAVGMKIRELNATRATESIVRIQEWRERIQAIVDGQQDTTTTPQQTQSPLNPNIVTAFARIVATAISLGNIIQEGNGTQAVREATRGGQDLQELIGLLSWFAGHQG